MSLYKRNHIWWASIYTHAGRLSCSTGTADRRQAQEFHDRLRQEVWNRERLGRRTVTWGEAVKAWLKIQPRGAPDRYRLRALGIQPMAPLPLASSLVEGLFSSRAWSSATWNRTLALIVAIHNTVRVTPPTVGRKKMPPGRVRWLTKEEWQRLRVALLNVSPLLEQCARFTLATGLRENNVLGLEWSQVDLQRRVAWIHADQTKSASPIGVPLNADAIVVLQERLGADRKFVFGNPDYVLYKASNRAWYAALRKAGLVGFRWHDLRHTWASWHVMNGTRIEELQQLGGWKTLSMVQRYAHLSTDHLARAAARVQPVSVSHTKPRQAGAATK